MNFNVNVNFQPEKVEVPNGYMLDAGILLAIAATVTPMAGAVT